ncbi:MAG TPA: hypothetical protein VKI61_14925 [Chitinophagaceae bacterium]|jgi:hypothetical protein|nr:hypothetical protein [Chitinophagaceae bacterium]
MADEKKFEESLLKILNQTMVNKERLKTVSSAIVKLKAAGLNIDQVNSHGVPQNLLVADRVIINGIIDPEFWRKSHQISEFGYEHFEVFPYGILNPEGYKFQITF